VRAFRQFLPPGTTEGKTKQECGQHVGTLQATSAGMAPIWGGHM